MSAAPGPSLENEGADIATQLLVLAGMAVGLVVLGAWSLRRSMNRAM